MIEPMGQRIRAIRKAKGLSMEDFGKLFDPPASKGVVSNWENNYNKPNNERVKKISEIGNISVEELEHGRKKDYIRPFVIELARYYYDVEIAEDPKLINYIISNLEHYDYGISEEELYENNKDLLDDIFMPGQWISEDYIYWTGVELTHLSHHLEEIYGSTSEIYEDTIIADSISKTVDELHSIISTAHENVELLYKKLSTQIDFEKSKIEKLFEDEVNKT